jgi:hypothetical protein
VPCDLTFFTQILALRTNKDLPRQAVFLKMMEAQVMPRLAIS